MSKWLDTRGRSVLTIAVCDRCHVKKSYDELGPDKNSPGLRVCATCCDNLDPYRLPARQTEKISVRFPRPDADIATTGQEIAADQADIIAVSQPGTQNGNVPGIVYTPKSNK